ncbi:hypothetical protein [Leisingera sp. F5]|uniref:hypothetical protein n=1 Tax=Leisingera sp. F5 TaxID=1813816 RepID=UPI000A58E25E|nr:hypothetical protein [Leisingera sp. F5]
MTEEQILEEIEDCIGRLDAVKSELFSRQFNGEALALERVGEVIDLFAELSALSNYTGCQLTLPRDIKDDVDSIKSLLGRYNTYRAQHRAFATKFRVEKTRSGSLVKLDESDIEKIQSLIDKTRKTIGSSTFLDDQHKQRLLARLEVLQSEIHKVQSDMDRALAGLVEVGDAMGKFGKKASPLVEAFEKIAGVFNSKREEPLQLPAPPKALPKPESPGPSEES